MFDQPASNALVRRVRLCSLDLKLILGILKCTCCWVCCQIELLYVVARAYADINRCTAFWPRRWRAMILSNMSTLVLRKQMMSTTRQMTRLTPRQLERS